MEAQVHAELRQLSDLGIGSVQAPKGSAAQISRLLDELPIKLPAEGNYLLELDNRTLHIFETTRGINRFVSTTPDAIAAIETDEKRTTLTVSTPSRLREIVLHREPRAAGRGNATLQELGVPLSAMQEYLTLTKRDTALSPAERVRKAELLKEIRTSFLEEKAREEQRAARRSTPPPSGESRISGGARSCG